MSEHDVQFELENAQFETSGRIMNVPGVGYMLAWGITVPTDAATGYGTGCIFMHTDGGDGTALYTNEGDTTSCNFNAVTVAAD